MLRNGIIRKMAGCRIIVIQRFQFRGKWSRDWMKKRERNPTRTMPITNPFNGTSTSATWPVSDSKVERTLLIGKLTIERRSEPCISNKSKGNLLDITWFDSRHTFEISKTLNSKNRPLYRLLYGKFAVKSDELAPKQRSVLLENNAASCYAEE